MQLDSARRARKMLRCGLPPRCRNTAGVPSPMSRAPLFGGSGGLVGTEMRSCAGARLRTGVTASAEQRRFRRRSRQVPTIRTFDAQGRYLTTTTLAANSAEDLALSGAGDHLWVNDRQPERSRRAVRGEHRPGREPDRDADPGSPGAAPERHADPVPAPAVASPTPPACAEHHQGAGADRSGDGLARREADVLAHQPARHLQAEGQARCAPR
jgi:hypothetical protein